MHSGISKYAFRKRRMKPLSTRQVLRTTLGRLHCDAFQRSQLPKLLRCVLKVAYDEVTFSSAGFTMNVHFKS